MSKATRDERNRRKIAARFASAKGEPCILYGGPPACVGMWTPTREIQDQLGRPPGKARLAIYSLCSDCLRIPDPSSMIEDRIIASHAASMAMVGLTILRN